jgi:hypothetical protein
VAVREGTRTLAYGQFQATVRRTKGARRGANSEVSDSCEEIIKTDETWVAALSRQLEAQEETVMVLGELKQKDSSWAQQEKEEKGALTGAQTTYEKAKQQRAQDRALCSDERT